MATLCGHFCNQFMKKIALILYVFSCIAGADVVKPALVEISIFSDKRVEVSIDLSLEAAMTGIGTQYASTSEAPNSDEYNYLRLLRPKELESRFEMFQTEFLDSINLSIDGSKEKLQLESSFIDIVGYTKRPRKSILKYSVKLSKSPKSIAWQFGKVHGDSALRYRVYKKDEYTWSDWVWLRDGSSSGKILIDEQEAVSNSQRIIEFISIGFDHVIPLGWDHLLFIVGMALSTLLWRRLLLLVTTFTVAHTITLGLSMYELVEISARVVEPLIAFSISYVAIENILLKQSIIRKSIIVFLFGLIHGLGFASMLKDFEMDPDTFLVTLISFNVGVELAQIVTVLGVVCVVLLHKKIINNSRKLLIIPVSVVIAIIGFWWGVERVIG